MFSLNFTTLQKMLKECFENTPDTLKNKKITDVESIILVLKDDYSLIAKKTEDLYSVPHIYFIFKLQMPNDQKIEITIRENLKNKKTKKTIKTIFQKTQKALCLQEKIIKKTYPNFQYILLNVLIKAGRLTPKIQNLLVENKNYEVITNKNSPLVQIKEDKGIKNIRIIDQDGFMQKFCRAQYFKIQKKNYAIQEFTINPKIRRLFIETEKINKKTISCAYVVPNTIDNFHTLLNLMQKTQKALPKLKF